MALKTFVSEKEIEEVKKKRQEEWEKVRRPDQPLRELLCCLTSLRCQMPSLWCMV